MTPIVADREKVTTRSNGTSAAISAPAPSPKKPTSRWHALPQPNYKPWSMRLSYLGAIVTIPAVGILLLRSAGSPVHIASYLAYLIGLMSMFIAAAIYHDCKGPESRVEMLRKFDYAAISLMIIGNFTPFVFIELQTKIGFGIFAGVVALGALAVYLIISHKELPMWGLIALYITMGWMGVFVMIPVGVRLGADAISLLVAGGGLYTIGTLVFNGDENLYAPRDFGRHEVWHIFILIAAALHYTVFYRYMLP